MSTDHKATVAYGVLLPGNWEQRLEKAMGLKFDEEHDSPEEELEKWLPRGLAYCSHGCQVTRERKGVMVCLSRQRHTISERRDAPTRDVSRVFAAPVTAAQRKLLVSTVAKLGVRSRPRWWMTWSRG